MPLPPPRPLTAAAIPRALAAGWQVLRCAFGLSIAFGVLLTIPGVLLLAGLQWLALAPLTIPLVGASLLAGPAVLVGLLGLGRAVMAGETPRASLVFRTWRNAPAGLWALAMFCLLMCLIWLTDAGTLYSFMVGERMAGFAAVLPQAAPTRRFLFAAVLTGACLAGLVFTATVHGIPLLLGRRTGLVGAVIASTRAVFAAPLTHLLWGLVLSATIVASLALPPLCALTLPWLAYSGDALTRAAFPREDEA